MRCSFAIGPASLRSTDSRIRSPGSTHGGTTQPCLALYRKALGLLAPYAKATVAVKPQAREPLCAPERGLRGFHYQRQPDGWSGVAHLLSESLEPGPFLGATGLGAGLFQRPRQRAR